MNGKTFTPNQTRRKACFDDTLEYAAKNIPSVAIASFDCILNPDKRY
jgi:hypothetical protein